MALPKVKKFTRAHGNASGQHYYIFVRIADRKQFPSKKKAYEAGYDPAHAIHIAGWACLLTL